MNANVPSAPVHISGSGGPSPGANGDAAAAIAAIAAWFDAREQAPEQDWDRLLTMIAERLRQVQLAPAVRDDAVVQDIFDDLPYARNMLELAADVDRLCDRVTHLLAHPADLQLAPGRAVQQRVPLGERALSRVKLRL